MLLRNISKHVLDQNWFAVWLDLLIVVIGVFLGIQVANWNAAQADKRTAQIAVERVQSELYGNRQQIQIWIGAYETYQKHALATIDGLERPVEQWDEQFIVDAYLTSGFGPAILTRHSYDDFLALGSLKTLIDEEVRQTLARHYFFLDAMANTLHNVPAYRSTLRGTMPHDVQTRIRKECPVTIDLTANVALLPENCQPNLSENQLERAVVELSAVSFKRDLNLLISDLYLKVGILRIVLKASEELDDLIGNVSKP